MWLRVETRFELSHCDIWTAAVVRISGPLAIYERFDLTPIPVRLVA